MDYREVGGGTESKDSKDSKGGDEKKEDLLSEDEAEATRTYMFLDPGSELTKALVLRPDIILFDAAKMHHDHFHRKISIANCIEEGRRKLVHAMRYGLTLVVALRTVSPDFIGLFNDTVLDASIVAKQRVDPISKVQVFLEKDKTKQMLDCETKQRIDTYSKAIVSSLPPGFLLHQGKHLLEGKWSEQLFRRADRDGPRDPPRVDSRFQVILTTELALDELDEQLFDGDMGLPRRHHFNIMHHNTQFETVLNELALPDDPGLGPDMLKIPQDRMWKQAKEDKDAKQITHF
jgi:hypothetical protein